MVVTVCFSVEASITALQYEGWFIKKHKFKNIFKMFELLPPPPVEQYLGVLLTSYFIFWKFKQFRSLFELEIVIFFSKSKVALTHNRHLLFYLAIFEKVNAKFQTLRLSSFFLTPRWWQCIQSLLYRNTEGKRTHIHLFSMAKYCI